MAKIIDLDQVKAGTSIEGSSTPVDPVPSGNDAVCGVDYVCTGNDSGCTIDYACGGGGDAPCLLADHACGRVIVPVEVPLETK